LPRRRLRVEEHVLREIRQPRLDVPRRRRIVARERVAVIPLRLDEPPALPNGNQRRADGRIAMRMQLHRRADDILDLVKAPVIHVPQRVQHAALHRLQPVINVRHRAVEDDVARVVEEPIPVALRQRSLLVLHLPTRLPLRTGVCHCVVRALRRFLSVLARNGCYTVLCPPTVVHRRSQCRSGVERQFGLIAVFGRFLLWHQLGK
jgi:hypothetical protein